MSPENQDALRCAENHQKIAIMEECGFRSVFVSQKSLLESSAHIRRLVAENEVKDALLRQAGAVIRWQCFGECRTEGVDGLPTPSEIDAAIREHLNK